MQRFVTLHRDSNKQERYLELVYMHTVHTHVQHVSYTCTTEDK